MDRSLGIFLPLSLRHTRPFENSVRRPESRIGLFSSEIIIHHCSLPFPFFPPTLPFLALFQIHGKRRLITQVTMPSKGNLSFSLFYLCVFPSMPQ